ncbi:terminase small subunit [Cytobacillus firmus]|uniref:terminase small subunit n=1 Tax=Cytobacillus firmus TaxID=1399 RepID=UPI001A7EBAE7|nr:terminase small subunit [Cytobacillus firmus]MBG9653722.1 terminase [Cytobacillus firmus]MED1904963.1 terminase small subunit [Cytobacillus firmus]
MPRKRDPNRDKAFEIFKQHNSDITNREIANQLGIDEKKVAVWKQRDKWNVVQQSENNVVQQKKKPQKKARSPNKKADKGPVNKSEELTDKQRFFAMYYVKYFNATKAYQKVYGCDYMTAKANGSRMLTNANLVEYIREIKNQMLNDKFLDAKDILQKYIDIAFADITDFVDFGQREMPELDHNGEPMIDENGEEITYSYSFVNLKNNDEVDGTLITEVKKGKDGVSVKLADKMKALEFLSKYTDLLSENDKKRLQEEKLRMEISKLQNNDETSQESQVAKMLRKLAGDE